MKDLTIIEYINQEEITKNIESVLKSGTPQFIASIISLVNLNPELKKTDKKSLLGACLTAASLDLPINPSLGFVFIIADKDVTGDMVAQFQMGYKGFIQLAMRSGHFKTINVSDVKEGEIVGLNRLSGEIEFSWLDEKERSKAKTVGYVAYLRLKNGFEKTLYMTDEELKTHGIKFSKNLRKGIGFWADEFDAMAKKTVLKLLLSKYAPMTAEMATAQVADQAVVIGDGDYTYIDNKKETATQTANKKEKDRILKFIKDAKLPQDIDIVRPAVTSWNDPELTLALGEREEEILAL